MPADIAALEMDPNQVKAALSTPPMPPSANHSGAHLLALELAAFAAATTGRTYVTQNAASRETPQASAALKPDATPAAASGSAAPRKRLQQ
jgi:hypothetical protein